MRISSPFALKPAAVGLLVAALAGCADDRRNSSGSVLLGPRIWDAVRLFDGTPVETLLWQPELPADTLSVTFTAAAVPGNQAPVAFGIRDLGLRELIDPGNPEFSINRQLRGRMIAVAMIPSSSAALPLSSNFHVRALTLGGDQTAEDALVKVSAWIKLSGTGEVETPVVQELPLTLFFVGTRLPDGKRLAAALGEAGRIWRRYGVELREPDRVLIAGEEGAALDRVEVDPALGSDSPAVGALLSLSERATAVGLPVFIVGNLVTGRDFPLWALSGSIPVPPVIGTVRSGVVISREVIDGDATFAGQVLAHEIGHALGLYHTTESNAMRAQGTGSLLRAVHDQIDDTADCPIGADLDSDGLLTARECDGHDASNLMFWAVVPDGTRLSPGQSEIARRSALVR